MKKFLIVTTLILAIGVALLGHLWWTQKTEGEIWQQNCSSLSSEVEYYKVKDSVQVTKINGLVLSLNDAENYNRALVAKLNNMKVENRELASLVEIQEQQLAQNPDTVYVHVVPPTDTTRRELKVFYKDVWTTADIKIQDCGDKAWINPGDMVYSTTDTITLANKIKYKGWWIFKRPVGVEIHLLNSNPNNHIIGGEYIEIRGRKRPTD